jgi:ferrous iron transport protein A
MRIRVLRVREDTPWSRRLEALGMTQGTVIQVIREAPLGDPLEIEVRGYRLCLRRKEIHALEWELLGDPV